MPVPATPNEALGFLILLDFSISSSVPCKVECLPRFRRTISECHGPSLGLAASETDSSLSPHAAGGDTVLQPERAWKALCGAKRGSLRSGKGGKGGKVKSREQAIAIGLSEACKKGAKVPKKKSR